MERQLDDDTLLAEREQLVGIWQSTDDQNAVIVFEKNGAYLNYYKGAKLDEGVWQPHGTDYRDGQYGEGLFIETNIDGELYGYVVYELTNESLVLNYLDRGNTLSYRRIEAVPSVASYFNSAQDWKAYQNDEYQMTFSYPPDWEVEEALKPRNLKALHEIVVWESDYDQMWRGMVSIFVFDNPNQLSVRGWLDAWLAEEDTKGAACREEHGDTSPCLFLRGLIEREYPTELAGKEAIALELFQFDHTEACVYAAHNDFVYGVCAPTSTNPNDPNAEKHHAVAKRIQESLFFID